MITATPTLVNFPHPNELSRIERKIDQARSNTLRCSARRITYWFSVEMKLARRQARLRGAWVPGMAYDWETVSLT